MAQLQPLIKAPITHSQIVRYAGASGDFNPIHTVVPVAKEAGLPDVIAHGMLIMGMAGQAITTWFNHDQIKNFSVRFQKMTFPGEELTVKGFIKEERDDLLICEVEVMNENKERKLAGTFHVSKEEKNA
ncbi:MaoC/PaaZ C-terminal domain-containing protein [Guptibacillus hwajinpoensis]|uniref:3-hydroxyacyl-ACP dehydratase n=1 Tax=Guptibacillus hwajinpoensis TaxID=208199 RepID=A0A0J6D283_9BACL|nr:MaoC/PaaZ C-terminal domain-containing protein [Alkalihalobacillus macyae]KMM39418.1 3-hydroxyacyl-ACP dehydratase [Alkalihalobacillus macyae]